MQYGWKVVRNDRTTANGFPWPAIGGVCRSDDAINLDNESPCPTRSGDGLTVALTFAGAASGGISLAEYPRIIVVGYDPAQVLSRDNDKLRVAGEVVVADEWDALALLREHGRGAYLRGANLHGAYLRGANLSSANLRGANLSGANLSDANLLGTNLHGAYLRGANLHGANLISANLSSANLRDANLSSANLLGTNLSSAYLRGANLRDANLRSANLSDANLLGTNLSSTIGLPSCKEEAR